MKKDIANKVNQWVGQVSAEIISTPIDLIDWRQMIESAIWRTAPFIEDKDKKQEKGFRDALILESVVAFSLKNKTIPIDFVSNDKVLREAISKRVTSKKLSFFESLSDYSSHLRLLDQQLTEEFVSAITHRAHEKFFGSKGRPGLWETEGIRKRISDQFSDKFEFPSLGVLSRKHQLNALARLMDSNSPTWQIESDETVWISRPSFSKKEGKNIYHWLSKFKFVQFFKNHGGRGGTFLTELVEPDELRMRQVWFAAKWSSNVGKDGRFSKVKLNELDFLEATFKVPTPEEIDRYGSALGAE